MPVQLVIQDGVPQWWNSSEIWVVPGNDPNGVPGSPIAGQPAYLWAHVANTGDGQADGVMVEFWWADPSLQVLRSTAHLIGSAFADISPGDSQDVLCLVPWNPVIVNHGHECLVAVAIHNLDNTLPHPPPNDFNPPAYPPIAQRNISVLAAAPIMLSLPLMIAAPQRFDKDVVVSIEIGGELDKMTLQRLNLGDLRPTREPVVKAGLTLQPECISDDSPLGEPELKLRVPRGTTTAVYAAIKATKLEKNQYQLVHVIERSADQILGGYSYIVVPEGFGG